MPAMLGPAQYVGRFAPSPTGPLHFGSLLAAVASYLQARANNGLWLLRIEDIDPPREQPGADKLIIDALEAYGFAWDGPICYQSRNTERHEALVRELRSADLAYPCACSRRDLAGMPRGPLGPVYPGTCRAGCDADEVAIRVRTDDDPVEFTDLLQGSQAQRLESESGDFVVKRRDGLIAYHLAVVADDHDQRISEIVRGMDLLDSTPRQIYLQRLLGFEAPGYAHVPVVEVAPGEKLSKQTGAAAIPTDEVRPVLLQALRALRQAPADDLRDASLESIWEWAIGAWNPEPLRHKTSIPAEEYALAAPENRLW